MPVKAPSFIEEETLWGLGYDYIAGVDEVGRGPLAGPVVAAAVVLPFMDRPSWLSLVRDSKMLTPRRRGLLYEKICPHAVSFGIGIIDHDVIDTIGILHATRMAMRSAIESLSVKPDYLLIDAVKLPEVPVPQRSIIKGDSLCMSIAVASIIAKVTRDRIMIGMDCDFPGYGLAQNKGYGTKKHIEGLRTLGPCIIHRKSFMPVQEFYR